jgi:hypothetical protein
VLLAPWSRKPKQVLAQALEVLACDTIERIRDGIRRYIVTFIDPVSHLAFAWGLPSKHARHTARALNLSLSLLPKAPKRLLSDNGSEFEADFAQVLQQHGIGRWYTYPKSPKMNAHVELEAHDPESFVDYHEELLFIDLALFNRKLADWLGVSDAERPHHALGQQSPLSFLIQHQPECQRYWTHTPRCYRRGFECIFACGDGIPPLTAWSVSRLMMPTVVSGSVRTRRLARKLPPVLPASSAPVHREPDTKGAQWDRMASLPSAWVLLSGLRCAGGWAIG